VRPGGRAAELVVFGEGSTGASNDLAGATQLATRMVREFGLSPELGPVGYSGDGSMFLGGEQIRSRPYAEATQQVIDSEVARLLREAEQAALFTLRAHTDRLDALADLLLEHETIDGAQVYGLVGRPIPGGPESPLTAIHSSSSSDELTPRPRRTSDLRAPIARSSATSRAGGVRGSAAAPAETVPVERSVPATHSPWPGKV